jgi:hypothetical protein
VGFNKRREVVSFIRLLKERGVDDGFDIYLNTTYGNHFSEYRDWELTNIIENLILDFVEYGGNARELLVHKFDYSKSSDRLTAWLRAFCMVRVKDGDKYIAPFTRKDFENEV